MVTDTLNILTCTSIYSKLQIPSIYVSNYHHSTQCWPTDYYWSEWTLLHWVAWFMHDNTFIIIWALWIILIEIPWIKNVHLGNIPISFTCQQGMVTLLLSNYMLEPTSSTAMSDLRWHQVCNVLPGQSKDFPDMGHHCQDMNSSKGVIVNLKCSTFNHSLMKPHHLQVYLECIPHNGKHSGYSAAVVQLYSSRTTFQYIGETPHNPPHEFLSACSSSTEADITVIGNLPTIPKLWYKNVMQIKRGMIWCT